MKAAVLYGKEDLQIESVAVPSIGDGDVLVRVQAALTCGTDVKVFRRGYHARMIVPPALFGHELAGDIVADRQGRAQTSRSASGWWRRTPPRVWSASIASAEMKISARICCSTTALTPNTFGFLSRIVSGICTKFPRTYLSGRRFGGTLACVLRGIDETSRAPGRYRGGNRLRAHRVDVRAPGEVVWCARLALGRRKTQFDRAAAMGADELVFRASLMRL